MGSLLSFVPLRGGGGGFIECFYDHLSAHLLLPKLGRWGRLMRDELGLKEKPEDTRYIKIRPKTLVVRAKDLIPDFDIRVFNFGSPQTQGRGAQGYCYHYKIFFNNGTQGWVPTGVWNDLAGGCLQMGLKLWFPPDPRRCSKFLNLNWWKGHCYHYKIFLIMVPRVGDGDPSFPVHPFGAPRPKDVFFNLNWWKGYCYLLTRRKICVLSNTKLHHQNLLNLLCTYLEFPNLHEKFTKS